MAVATKKVPVFCTKPRKEVVIDLDPGDTPAVVLRKAGLDPDDYFVLRPSDQTEYGAGENVYADEPGKLHVVPQSNVSR